VFAKEVRFEWLGREPLVACNSDIGIRTDAMRGVAVSPLDRLGRAIVVTDVAHELAGQVLDRGEDSAGNHIAFDPGEPVFYLIEPGGVGRRVVQMYFRVSREELFNPLSLMGRQIVRNDVNLLAARLIGDQVGEESHKFLTGVARGGFAHHLAAFGVKRGVQRKRVPWR